MLVDVIPVYEISLETLEENAPALREYTDLHLNMYLARLRGEDTVLIQDKEILTTLGFIREYLVESFSRPGMFHTVTERLLGYQETAWGARRRATKLHCTCEAFTYFGNCKHVRSEELG